VRAGTDAEAVFRGGHFEKEKNMCGLPTYLPLAIIQDPSVL